MHIEREIKLHLRREAEDALVALAPRRRNVFSVYFDTPRRELRRAGMALRLRRDGKRWVQTLKADRAAHAGLATRSEWELPVNGAALEPGRFPQDEVRRSTGVDLERLARRLRPVFETRFVRRSGLIHVDGEARAELAIDRGLIVAGARREPIAEVELELVSGASDALLRYAERLGLPLAYESKAERGYRLADDEGARPHSWRMPAVGPHASPGEAFAAVFGAALAQVGSNAAGMASSREPEYLHQARVGLRRLRSALRAFSPILQRARPLKRALPHLAPALGAARDADVLLETLHAVKATPPALRAARAYRDQARSVIPYPALEGFLFQALRWLDGKPWTETEQRLADFAAERLERLHGKVMRRPDFEKAKERHRLRVRIKRLRYACEFLAPAFPPDAVEAYVKPLRALQDVLGDLNDVSVGRRRLRKLGVEPPAALSRREAQLRPKLALAWERFEAQAPYWRPPARRLGPAAR